MHRFLPLTLSRVHVQALQYTEGTLKQNFKICTAFLRQQESISSKVLVKEDDKVYTTRALCINVEIMLRYVLSGHGRYEGCRVFAARWRANADGEYVDDKFRPTLQENELLVGLAFISQEFEDTRGRPTRCFQHLFVEKDHRKKGIATEMITGVSNHFHRERLVVEIPCARKYLQSSFQKNNFSADGPTGTRATETPTLGRIFQLPTRFIRGRLKKEKDYFMY